MAEMITGLDIRILTYVQEHFQTAPATAFWKFITLFGDYGLFWIALTLLLVIWSRTRRTGCAVMISLALDFMVVNLIIKKVVARPRPYDTFSHIGLLIDRQSDFSFPSGHTAASFACALVLVRMLPKKYGVPLVILACLISFSRIYLGVHYPSDVFAGFLIGLLTSQIGYYVVQRLQYRSDATDS